MQVQLFTPYNKQKEIINGFANSKHLFGVVVAPRGSGKTLLAANLLLYWALSKNDSKCGWISPIYNQAKSVFETIVKAAFDVIASQNKAELTITFINGSTLKFLSADSPNSVRGFRFEYLILDEVAYITESAITEAILPTLNPLGKKCLMISTPRSKNHFYEWYMKGLESNNIISFKIPLTDCPYVKPELIEEAKKSLPPEIFKQEYNAEFGESTNDVFIGVDLACNLNGFEEPIRGKRYFAGIDLALSNDYSVLSILDESGRMVYVERINGTSYADVTKSFINSLKKYNIQDGYCEINGPGLPVYEVIHSHIKRIRPFTTTSDTKTSGIRRLIYDIQAGGVELPSKQLFSHLYNELTAYTYKISPNGTMTFSHPPGLHDDCVMSLMLANEARNNVFTKSKIYVGGSKSLNPQFGNSSYSY
jgi:hypothetical protein